MPSLLTFSAKSSIPTPLPPMSLCFSTNLFNLSTTFGSAFVATSCFSKSLYVRIAFNYSKEVFLTSSFNNLIDAGSLGLSIRCNFSLNNCLF